jgi:hypothetical protein
VGEAARRGSVAMNLPGPVKCLFKSPFSKGGFRGIIKRLYNPPCPPLKKGGKILALIGAFSAKEKSSYL